MAPSVNAPPTAPSGYSPSWLLVSLHDLYMEAIDHILAKYGGKGK